jgi:hypothetical protein
MRRFQQAPNPLLSGAIVFSLATVFVLDFYTPLGITVWVLYLIPVVLAYLFWFPVTPVAVAGAVTILTLAGLLLSPPGIDPSFHASIAWLESSPPGQWRPSARISSATGSPCAKKNGYGQARRSSANG